MYSKTASLILLLCVVLSCFAQDRQVRPARELDGLKGAVEWVATSVEPLPVCASALECDLAISPFLNVKIVTYDREGNKTSADLSYPQCGNLDKFDKHERTYNKAGKLIKEFTYDSISGSLKFGSVWKYDAQERVKSDALYNHKGRVESERVYQYDEQGRIIEETLYRNSRKGKVFAYKETRTYDKQGRVIEVATHNRDDSLRHTDAYAYEDDAQGNWIKEVRTRTRYENRVLNSSHSSTRYRLIFYYQ